MRVLNRQPSSPLNVENFLDTKSEDLFPRSFVDGTIGGDFAPQHTSDLVRWPLLLKYGGVYADVGMMQIGDLDGLWLETIDNPDSSYEVLTYNCGTVDERILANYFLASKPNNPFFERSHKLLLKLWAADGGRTNTEGMHSNPLLKGVELMGRDLTYEDEQEGRTILPDEASRLLTDYIIQGQVMTLVLGLADEEDGWDGPKYAAERVYAIEYMEGSQLINEYTAWNGFRAFELMSLSLPKSEEKESENQKQAREIVEGCLERSFGFKLAHGMILKVFKETLGSLWRKNEGSDYVPGTYAHWLREGMVFWCPNNFPPRMEFQVIAPLKRGSLLRET